MADLCKRVQSGRINSTEANHLADLINQLDPALIQPFERAVRWILDAPIEVRRRPLERLFGPPPAVDPQRILYEFPRLALLMVFNANGRTREFALTMIQEVSSAFGVAAIACRMNDWVPQVRAAAVACAARSFPSSDSSAIADAAMAILRRRDEWSRWGAEAAAFDRVVSEPRVQEILVDRMCRSTAGITSRIAIPMFKLPPTDAYLERLAQAAAPNIRAKALHCLITREVRWRAGTERVWIDKTYGQFRLAAVYGKRPITVPSDPGQAIVAAANDPAATVRRVAADIFLADKECALAHRDLVRKLAADTNRRVFERAGYVLKHLDD